MKYRTDIDGLRAIAVLAVVLFHTGMTWLPGGFLGVDVFFTISGFLITSIILAQKEKSSFKFGNFYLRRIRRLFPALVCVLVATLLAAALIFPPSVLKRVATETAAALFSVSNFYYSFQTGYFAPESETMPLLHTWSLAVEEQFYLIWPLFLVVSASLFKRAGTIWILAIVGAASLAVTSLLTTMYPAQAFYWMPFRIYEFAIGGLLGATGLSLVTSNSAKNALTISGLVILIASFLLVTPDMHFPGFWAAVPCLGAGLIIASNQSQVSRYVLSNPVMRWIGQVSYSFYLTHWPIVVFYLVLNPGHLDLLETSFLVAASLGSAALIYYLVENPIRRGRWFKGPPLKAGAFSLAAGSVAVALGSLAFGVYLLPQTIKSFVASSESLAVAEFMEQTPGDECDTERKRSGFPCLFGAKRGMPVALIGDSHAQHFRPGLADYFAEREILGLNRWAGGCPPILGVYVIRDDLDNALQRREECYRFARQAVRAASNQSDVAIIAARWSIYIGDALTRGREIHILGTQDVDHPERANKEQSEKVLRVYLESTVQRLTSSGVRVILVEQIPPLGINRGLCLSGNSMVNAETDCRGFSAKESVEVVDRANQVLRDIAASNENVFVLSAADEICPQSNQYCLDSIDDIFLWRDDDHLNAAGSKVLVHRLGTKLDELLFPGES